MDGAKVSDALLKRASALRDQANTDDANNANGAFDIAEFVIDDFNYRQRILNDALRLE